MRADHEDAYMDPALPEGPLLVDQLRFMAAVHPDAIAYRDLDAGGSITFREWDEVSNRLARRLTDHSVRRGDRVSIYLSSANPLRWIVTYAAAHKAGAVAVPTNTRLSERELTAILRHAEVAAMVTDAPMLSHAVTIGSALPTLATVLDASLSASAFATTSSTSKTYEVHRWFEINGYDGGPFQVAVAEDDLPDVMYTSGTTGLPKGVAVRHRDAAMMPNNAPSWTGDGRLHGAPMFTFAGIAFVYSPMKLGLTGIYQPTFDAGRRLKIVEVERLSMIVLVPAMAELIVAHPRFFTTDLSSPLIVSIGSSPLARATLELLRERMPHAAVSNSYGLTEAGPAYIVMPKEEGARRPGSIGKAMPPMETRIVVPESGEEALAHTIGELQTRLPGKQREYYRNAEATSNAWTPDGRLRTGDLAYCDKEGFIYVVGRLEDVIIRGGNNVYATDVETVIIEHPAVQECAVIGVPHEVLGEDVAAWVVVRPGGSLSESELLAFLADRLADYKCPRFIRFVDELPRNATGKVMKHLLRERLTVT